MDAALAAAQTPMLHCCICPKKPNFSDVSHLLTHISSKSHLNHKFQLEMRVDTDVNARMTMNRYNRWLALHNIDRFLAERIQMKDQKGGRGRVQDFSARPGNEKSEEKVQAFDPFFSTSFFANAPPPNGDAAPLTLSPTESAFSLPKSYKPRLHLWSTQRPTSIVAVPLRSSSSPPPVFFPTNDPFPLPAPFAPMLRNPPQEYGAESQGGGEEATKLKGVLWPGMDIFDAATPETKRKRNQKKDTFVAKQLEDNSLCVEPTEMIFTPFGTLKKSRTISGNPDLESSPEGLKLPSPRPRRRRSRVPLSNRDVNTKSVRSTQQAVQPSHPLHGALPNQVSQVKKRKRGFSVFNEKDEQPFGSQTGMKYLTSEFHFPAEAQVDSRFRGQSTLANARPPMPPHYLAGAFEPIHPTFFGMPYYGLGYYGHSAYEMPSFFQHALQTATQEENVSAAAANKIEGQDDAVTLSANSDS